jgi:putative transposase
VSERVARSRLLVAEGYALAAVARVMQVSRQALYRLPRPRSASQRRPPADAVEQAIVEVAKANPTDGYRMVWALVRRRLGVAVNRKRVLRVLREQGLIQRRRSVPRRRRPGFFRVERPGQLWHMDMTSIWVAEHGWCYLNAIIDCCTRELVGWSLDVRCRASEAIAVFEAAIAASGFVPDELEVGDEAERLTLGTDNGTAFTSRAFRAALAQREVAHRRGGYRDPESQAFIESWFAKLKEREVWLNEYETLNDARSAIGRYVDRYHHRPHSGLDYKTPLEVRQTWEDLQKQAA